MNDISWLNIVWASFPLALILICSGFLRLNLNKSLLIGAVRTVTQLFLLSLVLRWVFLKNSPLILFAAATFMVFISSHTIIRRVHYRLPGLRLIVALAIAFSIIFIGIYSLLFVLPKDPWFRSDHAIPLIGIMTGNSLTAISLAINQFLSDLKEKETIIENRLAWGATTWEAILPHLINSFKTGLHPIMNSMMVVGLVSIPGVMTGQLLSGSSPKQAAIYQIVILFMIVSCAFFSILLSLLLAFKKVVNTNQQSFYFSLPSEEERC